jgi:prenyltransferase/squalene oxidase-like repeat protein
MNTAATRKRAYNAAVERALEWILSHQQPDGGFGRVETMSHYMVLGASLLYTGHGEAAGRLMRAIKSMFVRSDGSFDPPEIRAGRTSALAERCYAPAWVVYSSHVNLAYDISLRAMPHVLQLQDAKSGGMFGAAEDALAGMGIVNCAVTSVTGEAALTTGYIAEATRMGDHLVDNVLASNSDLSHRFYPIWDTERGLRTDPGVPESPNMPRVIERFGDNQHHYLTGMMIAFLTDLHRVTRTSKYLDGALTIYEFAAGGSPAIYETTLAHKFAWGCAWLYRLTENADHLESACRVCDYLVSRQEQDGSFVHWGLVKSAEEWPYSPRLNITAQFALWIARTAALL